MAFKLAEIFTELTVRDSQFRKGIRGARGNLMQLSDQAKNAAVIAAGVFTAAGIASVKFLRMSAEASESMSKFRTVFRDQADETLKWADNFAEATGRSRFALRTFLAGVQDLFVPLGFAREEAAELSKQVVTLATDLSSFANIPVADVMRDIQSALVGNSETVRKYGVVVDAAVTQQKALEMTGKQSAKQITNQEKVMARLALIMGSTTDAQGDAIRTSDSLANQMVRLESTAEEVGIQIGTALVPAALDLLKTTRELTPALKEFFGTAGQGAKFIREVANGIAGLVDLSRSLENSWVGWALRNASAAPIKVKQAIDFAAENVGRFAFDTGAAPDLGIEETNKLLRTQVHEQRRGNRISAETSAYKG